MTGKEPILPSGSRIQSIDVIRGFALLGILAPNLLAFAWPDQAMWSPEAITMGLELQGIQPAHEAANQFGHLVVQLFFFGKMMFLFSILFGGGLVLFARKFENGQSKLRNGAGLWYRRMGWLLLIGLLHGVLLWPGDILVFYALIGMGVLWWMRRWPPGALFGVGSIVYLLATVLMVELIGLAVWDHKAGHGDLFAGMASQIVGYQGGWAQVFNQRLHDLSFMYLFVLPFYFVFAGTGMMLIGIALMKKGVLTGERPDRFYKKLAGIGIPLGLMLTAGSMWIADRLSEDAPGFLFQSVGQLVGTPLALGYAGLLILLVKRGLAKPITSALAAVGRMALTNYLLQSLICTSLFYGYGLGLYAQVEYPGLAIVLVCVWAVNILFSVLWLRFFRFGPCEWVWRCLTYWRLLPLKRAGERR